MQKIILIFFAFFIFSIEIYSQCNPDLDITPGQECATAPFVCDLDGYCANMQMGNWGGNQVFCNGSWTLQNPNWFAFVANSTTIDIEVALSDCTGGQLSVQWGLYNQCTNLLSALQCNGSGVGSGGVISIIYPNAVPGTVYYIVLDGTSGAICHYEVNVNSGIGTTLVAPAVITDLSGNAEICVGASVNYSFPGFGFATEYTWTLPSGATVTSSGPSVTVNYSGIAPGDYQICVTGTNECDPVGQNLCWPITVNPKPELSFVGEACQGKTYRFRGSDYPPGSYNFTSNGPPGTSCDTTIQLIVDPLYPTYGPDLNVYICPEDLYAFIDGVPYSASQAANVVTYVNSRGCDSLVNYYVNNVKLTGNIVAVPASLPCGGSSTSTLALSPSWDFPPFSYSIDWYDGSNNLIGSGVNSVQINTPGYYYAVVTTVMSNIIPENPNITPQMVSCEKLFDITIPAENSVLTAPVATGPTVLCAGVSGTFQTDIQLGATSYSWEHTGGNVTGGGNQDNISLKYDVPGMYEICVNAVDACGPGPQSCFQIQVVPSAVVSMESNHAVCGVGDSLRAVIGQVPNVNDPLMQYLWTVVSGPDVSGVVFSAGNKPKTAVTVVQPGLYTFYFSADYNGQGCGETDSIKVTFEKALELTSQDIQACNDVNQPLPSVISLDTLLTSNGVSYTGTWTFKGGPGTPGGVLPIQDYTGMTQTGVYTYQYVSNKTGVCEPDTVEVKIDLTNCICPPLSINSDGGTTCNDNGSVNLNTLIQGGTGAGSWSVTSQPGGGSASIAGGVVDFGSQPMGSYVFTYKLQDTLAGCPSKAITTVNVVPAPQAQLKPAEQACNSNFSPDYVNEVDFDTLIVSGLTNGVWAYSGSGVDPGSGSFHPKDFNGATPGTYEYSYTVSGDASCDPVTYKINIVVEDCKCPSVAITPFASFCNTTGVIDLTTYKVTTKPGKWHFESGPVGSTATITGDKMFNGTGSAYGTYVVYYKLDEAVPLGCEDTSQMIIRLDSTANAGIDGTIGLCEDYQGSIDLDTVLTQQQGGGVWVYTGSVGIGSSFNATTGQLNMGGLPQGLGYTFNYTVSSPMKLCPDDKSTITVDKNVLPQSDAGTDGYIDCVTTTVSIGGSGTSSGTDYTYEWINKGTGTVLGTTSTISGLQDAGTYELIVTNTKTGCEQRDEVVVTKDNAAISAINYTVDSISCYNKGDGQIQIVGIDGGTPAFSYALDGSNYSTQTDYSNVGPGNHILRVTDVNGCKYEVPIYLDNPKEVTIELGQNTVIPEGDVVTIVPDVEIGVNGGVINWISNPPGTNCNNCDELTVRPLYTTTYIATVSDKNGCSSTDSLEVRVKSVIRVFMPNVISPNNDGVNDVFYVQSDRNVQRVKSMTIYNRWGDVQYSIKDVPPNEEGYGWNGRYGEQRANTPAVFVYQVVLLMRDGREIVYKGDITVVR